MLPEATKRYLLKMDPHLPKRTQTMSLPDVKWHEVDEADAEKRALARQNLFICAIAGTGKSHFCLKLVEKLRP